MTPVDEEIDQLYQLPLAEFTAARDTLAKRRGAAGADVRTLQKPNAAAWAVNQLYWRRRKAFDRLTHAAELLRAAHAARLGGKAADISAVEASHREALHAAIDEIRALLEDAGDSASPATIASVTETLETLPWAESPGRLTRPLKPRGFEALAGILVSEGSSKKHAAVPVPPVRSAAPAPRRGRASADAKQESAERARERTRLKRELTAAGADECAAHAALERARRDLAHVTDERAKLDAAIEQAIARAHELRQVVNDGLKRVHAAATERARLAQRLSDLES